MQQNIKINDQLTIQVNRMGINGEGIGYHDKLAVFIDNALPGELVDVRITEIFENRAVAEVVKIIKASKDRVVPFCPIYDACGGCQTQHFNYQAMLAQKKDILVKSLNRYVKSLDKSIVKDTIGMDDPRNYRNKASLPVRKVNGKNRFGMFARNSNQFIAINDCGVQRKELNDCLMLITKLMDKHQIDSYNLKTKKGYISSLVVRISENIKEIQISFIVAKKIPNPEQFIQELVSLNKAIASIFEVINEDTKRHNFFTDNIIKLYGKDTIDENLHGYNFILKPEAFFQLNTTQADKFYQIMQNLADLKPNETAIDAYAGIAPISHYIHQNAKKIYAIELNKEASISAKLSLKENNIKNVVVINQDFEKALKDLKEKHIDVMLFDPPRVGLGSQTIKLIKQYRPKRLVYGSCNPSTLAKDLNELVSMYQVKSIVPIDMFPYTSLVESVTLLELI